jgi:biotin transport system substrate-specific component
MADSRLLQSPLAQSLWPADAAAGRAARNLILVVLGSVALAVSAKVSVPFFPVPMTMQTYVVLAIGMAFGARLAGATVLAYLVEGALGLPVFTTGAGLAYMAGPTGGYLLGFLVAAVAVGWLAERGWDRSLARCLPAMLIGQLVIFALGVAWLAQILGDWDKAVVAGLLPFVWGEVFKTALAAATLPFAWRLLRRFRTL